MNRLKYILVAFLAVGLFFACDKEFSDLEGDEMAKLNAWVQVKNIPTESLKTSGLYYISTQEGTGLTPEDGDFVIYSYVEKSLDGYIYFSNNYSTAKLYEWYDANFHYSSLFTKNDNKGFNSFSLNPLEGYPINSNFQVHLTRGVQEGLSYMKEGGKATLIMPSKLAYGRRGNNYSPIVKVSPYESLVCEVELIKVVKNPRDYEKELIQDYIDDKYPGLVPFNDSIYYIQLSPPTHDSVVGKDSIVKVYYKGMLMDGFVFDTNIDSVQQKLYGRTFKNKAAFEVTIGKDVITGFSQALKKLNYGEWARFIIPSSCGYDSIGNGSIPPFTPLIYDIYYYKKVKNRTSSSSK